MQGGGQADEVLKYFKCKANAAGAVPCERLPLITWLTLKESTQGKFPQKYLKMNF